MEFKNFLIGGGAAAMTSSCLQPLDVIKTLLLYQHKVNSIMGCIKYVHEKFGILGFWKGNSASFMRSIIGGGTLFFFLELIREKLGRSSGGLLREILTDSVASFIGRGIAVTIQCPLSVIKVQMENPSHGRKKILGAISEIYGKHKIKGFWKGLAPNLLRDVPYTALSVPFYEQYAKFIGRLTETDKRSNLLNFVAGGLSGFSASLVTQPFDVMKNRAMSGYQFHGHTEYPGLIKGLKIIYEQEGVQGFTKGLLIRGTERSMGQALIWMFYIRLKRFVDGDKK
ncbi:unnamed protein product [Blepharisma stoltei]|uniref:Mitochondrial carrier protein n=1 Tax=Blepharisma stoltei TaxID=1481888 RepID=A0AAU9IZ18_9CILI|nr:unnamed protein product [Blepharisma stoltei]